MTHKIDTTDTQQSAPERGAPAEDAEPETGTAPIRVTVDDIRAAQTRIRPHLHRTPLISSDTLSRMTHTDLWLKAEVFQKTGSFKTRGALNAVLELTPEQRARGVVTLSAGNHGQGLAYAASMVGARCVVFMPEHAIPTKVQAIKEYGAEARFAPSMEFVFPAMQAYQQEHGLTYVPPFSDPAIIAGQGTIGLEILEDLPDVEAVVVPVGGGGLLAGIALAIKSIKPDVRIVGVEPEGASAVSQSIKTGKLVTLDHIDTVADGLAAPFAGAASQAIVERCADDVVLVSDDEIIAALRLIVERTKIVVEPSGAAGVAALLAGKAGVPWGAKTVAILSGGNVDRETLKALL